MTGSCPKHMLLGPCGGVRADGSCEVVPDPCVFPVPARWADPPVPPVPLRAVPLILTDFSGIDLVHDDETFAAGRRLECPVLVLWGTQGFVGRGYQPLSVWQEYASDVRGEALPTGHFLPEEAPDLVTAALRDFLS
jgi:pimeloyl-ACP methyl ester carboxylesterase